MRNLTICKSSVPRSDINEILREIFKLFRMKGCTSIDFDYKNGNKDHAIIIPKVQDEESFQK